MFDTELESFKIGIDLRAYAAEQGYQLDRKESWRGSAVMRHPNGDKIVIKRDDDNHYVYFSVRQDNDSGSIIDFVQYRQRLSLGAVRKELRPYIGLPSSRLPDFPPLPKTSKDRMRVETEYAKMQDACAIPILRTNAPCPLLCSKVNASPVVSVSTRGVMRCSRISTRTGFPVTKSKTKASRVSVRAERRGFGCYMSGLTITGSCSAKVRLMR